MKHVMRYLRGTTENVLCFGNESLILTGYSDANKGDNLDTRRSTLGCVFLLNIGVFSLASKKQDKTSLSSMEVEFMACSSRGCLKLFG